MQFLLKHQLYIERVSETISVFFLQNDIRIRLSCNLANFIIICILSVNVGNVDNFI